MYINNKHYKMNTNNNISDYDLISYKKLDNGVETATVSVFTDYKNWNLSEVNINRYLSIKGYKKLDTEYTDAGDQTLRTSFYTK